MFTNTIAYAFRCQPRKQLYLIAFVDLECTIHKGEPEPRKGNVNTVYFIIQARANTGISRAEFIYDESMRLQMV